MKASCLVAPSPSAEEQCKDHFKHSVLYAIIIIMIAVFSVQFVVDGFAGGVQELIVFMGSGFVLPVSVMCKFLAQLQDKCIINIFY